MMKLVTQEQIKKLESDWIQQTGQGWSLALMERAGLALVEASKVYNEPFLIICGKGNNGGDGIVAARHLASFKKKVNLCLTSDESLLSNDAKVNLELVKDKVNIVHVLKEDDSSFDVALKNSNTIIDCILGTGSNNSISGLYEWLVKKINDSKKDVIACDVPTGVNPNTGEISTVAIKAKETITIGYVKIGLVVYPAKKYTGTIRVVDIGLPDIETNTYFLDSQFARENFPKRQEDSNKGNYGRTLVIAGSEQYPGAALLASKAAASIGSGITSLASKKEVFIQITPVLPEVTHVEFNINTILEESMKSSVIVLGPGLTCSDEVKNLVEEIIKNVTIPIVLDADGINVLAGRKEILKLAKSELIITPHPKEFARLLECNVDEILKDKISLVRKVSSELNCTILLKGPGTIVSTKGENSYISPFANSALAKGGTGDVLAGFIGGLIAQKANPSIAACLAVYIHGKTGELIANEKTVFSLLPQDLIAYLPSAIKELKIVC